MNERLNPQEDAKTVLVADDDEVVLNLVRFRLERDGYRVIVATDGQTALGAIREHLPDMCVLDVMMPKLGGLEVLQLLRSDPETAGVRVILLTARSHEIDLDHGFESGADDYLTKPFSPQELRQRVRAQLSR